MATNTITKDGQIFGINSQEAFESERGTIAARDRMLRLPSEGELFYLTSDIDTAFGGRFANQVGYMENGKLKVFNAEDQIAKIQQQSTQEFEKNFNRAGLRNINQQLGNGGTASVDIGGQNISITKHRSPNYSYNMNVYTATYPDGTTKKWLGAEGLGHSATYGFINEVINKAIGYEGVIAGQNTTSSDRNSQSNIAKITQNQDFFKEGQLNTYSRQQLESFVGKATSVDNMQDMSTRFSTYQEKGLPTTPTFFKEETNLTGSGASSYGELVEQMVPKINQSQGIITMTNTKTGDTVSIFPNDEQRYRDLGYLGEGETAGTQGVSQVAGDSFKKEFPTLTPTSSYQLKNQGIASANPGVKASPGFINALYQEGFQRDATQAEQDKFANSTVKDASNLILGAQRSPFSGTRAPVTPQTGIERGEVGTLTEAQVRDAFESFGYEPDLADVKYWTIKGGDQLETLYDNLMTRKEKQAEAEKGVAGEEVTDVSGELFLRGGDNGALIKFSEDPDGPGPQSTSTIWLIDPTTKTLKPILSEEAFNNYFEDTLQEAAGKGLIKTVSMNYMNQGSPLFGYKLLTDEYGIKEDGSMKTVDVGIDLNKVSNRYGYKNDDELNKNTFKILNGFLSTLKGDQNIDLSAELIDEISNDKEVVSMYINALAYGGYQVNDIYRDLKIRDLVKKGKTQYADVRAIDEGMQAEQYYNTPAGNAVRTNPDFAPPKYIGDIESSVFDMPIFDIPSDVYETLVPPFDWRSPEGQAELDKIKSAYHDVLLQQTEATTEREQVIADQSYKMLQEEINKKYGIALSDNANDAWKQLVNMGSDFSQRGLHGTGLAREGMDKYLSDVRKQDARAREAQLTEEESQRRTQLIKYGTPEQIAALSDEEKEKYGFKPTQEVLDWFSADNLKSLYPNLSDREIESYKTSMLDEGGNYRSELYQKLAINKMDIEEEKRTYQLGGVQVDPTTGKVTGGTGVLYKKALEEEKAYEPFTRGEDFSKPTEVRTPTTSISPSDSSQWSINKTPTTPWQAPTGYERISGPSQISSYGNVIDEPGTINKWGTKSAPTPTPTATPTVSPSDSSQWSINKPTTPVWQAPTGYTKITGPSQLPQYTSIVDEPGTIHKWGIKK